MSVFAVTEYQANLTGTQQQLQDINTVNYAGARMLREDLGQDFWASLLGGVSGVVLSELLGATRWTLPGLAASMASVFASVSQIERTAQSNAIDQGSLTLENIISQFGPSFSQVEVTVSFLEFEMTDGTRQRYVQGTSYVPIRALTPSGWIAL